MEYVIDYAKISPTGLDMTIRSRVQNAFCTWNECADGNCFSFEVMGWLPLTDNDRKTISEIVEPYAVLDLSEW